VIDKPTQDSPAHPLVVGISGASGAIYAHRLLQILVAAEHEIHLTVSPAGASVFEEELGIKLSLRNFQPEQLRLDQDSVALQTRSDEHRQPSRLPDVGPAAVDRIRYFDYRDLMAPIASGSHLTHGMVICPCSGSTVSAVVTGASNNLIHRAADVHLKERRPLILVPREAPLSLVHLDNLRRATEAGAVVIPASPGWYHGVQSIHDLVDFIVARILDQLGLPNSIVRRWGHEPNS